MIKLAEVCGDSGRLWVQILPPPNFGFAEVGFPRMILIFEDPTAPNSSLKQVFQLLIDLFEVLAAVLCRRPEIESVVFLPEDQV